MSEAYCRPLRRSPHQPGRRTLPAEAIALGEEARRCWSAATGRPAAEWTGAEDPRSGPLEARALEWLAAGAAVRFRHGWAILLHPERGRLLLAEGVLRALLAAARGGVLPAVETG